MRRPLGKLRGDLFGVVFRALRAVVPDQHLPGNQIDDAPEGIFGAHRNLHRNRNRMKAAAHHVENAEEVRADAVHFIDERDLRNAVLVRLMPDRFRLRLDARHRAEHDDRAVQDAQRALHLDGKVDVARRIDDMDFRVFPGAGGYRGRDGNAALLLLRHPVHHRCAVVHLAHLIGLAGVKKDSLADGGLACVDMSDDADIPRARYFRFRSHNGIQLFSCLTTARRSGSGRKGRTVEMWPLIDATGLPSTRICTALISGMLAVRVWVRE